MDRQAMALFGGIVAVGLGPAIWLGGTLVRTDPAPPVPTVTWQQVTASPGADNSTGPSPDPLPTLPADFSGIDVDPDPAGLTPTPSGSPGGVAPTPSPTGSTPDPTPPPDSPAPPSGTPSPVPPTDVFGG